MRHRILLLLFFALPFTANSATIHVPGDYTKIQEAIDAAVNGDTVAVAPGVYLENIVFNGKAITVRSDQGPGVTTIDGGNPQNPDKASVVSFKDNEGLDSVLDGFTITNGKGTYIQISYYGGGILCYKSSPTIVNNNIVTNQLVLLKGVGGGIFCLESSAFIANNNIHRNTDRGIWCSFCPSLMIVNNDIFRNEEGGIYCQNDSSPTIMNNSIHENGDKHGGGIGCHESSPLIAYNTLYRNTSSHGGGISLGIESSGMIFNNIIHENRANSGGGIWSHDSSAHIANNLIFGNEAHGMTGRGGGIDIMRSSIVITGNLICRNRANGLSWGGGGGLMIRLSSGLVVNNTLFGNAVRGPWGGGAICSYDSTLSITNTICWNNSAPVGPEIHTYSGSDPVVTYCDVEGGYPGTGNISTDPLFMDPGGNDIHIRYSSPCRNAGDNAAVLDSEDFEGNPRIAQGTVDMGADEFSTHLYCTGDATPGGKIEAKFVGIPGTFPVGLWFGSGLLDPPLQTMFGQWYLEPPWTGPVILGPIPSPDGVLILPATIHRVPAPPYDLYLQALIGLHPDSLTDPFVIEVR